MLQLKPTTEKPLFKMKTFLNNHKAIRLFLMLCLAWWIAASVLLILFPRLLIFQTIHIYHSEWADSIMPYITKGGEGFFILSMALIALFLKYNQKSIPLFVFITLSLILPTLLTNGLKLIAAAPRPLTVFAEADWIHTVRGYKNNYYNSWPSGHTTGVFSLFALLTCFLKNSAKAWAVFYFILALLVAYSRIYLAQHFFEDVLTGSLIGTLIPFYLFYFFHKKYFTTLHQ